MDYSCSSITGASYAQGVARDRRSLDDIPDDALIKVFRYLVRNPPPGPPTGPTSRNGDGRRPPAAALSSSDASSHAFVSRRWLKLANDARESLRLTPSGGVSSAQLVRALRRMPSLTTLTARGVDDLRSEPVKGDLLKEIAKACPHLLRLCLDRSPLEAYAPRALSSLFHGCPLLEELSLYCPVTVSSFPASIVKLTRLVRLSISSAFLLRLPDEIGELHALESFHLDAYRLTALPNSIGNLESLQDLTLICKALLALPESIGQLLNLTSFRALDCNSMDSLPDALWCCTSLIRLVLALPARTIMPWHFRQIGQLESVRLLDMQGFELSDGLAASITHLLSLQVLSLRDCTVHLPEDLGTMTNLMRLELRECTGVRYLPSSLPLLSRLDRLAVSGCRLVSLPAGIGRLRALRELELSADSQSLPESLGQLRRLGSLKIYHCNNLEALPESVTQLGALKTLSVCYCATLSSLPRDIQNLSSLAVLTLSNCAAISQLPASLALCPSLRRVSVEGCAGLTVLPDAIQHLAAHGTGGQ